MIGENIRNLRKQKKLSQMQFADLMGFSRSLIANWEREERDPNTADLIKIADYFDVSVDYLLGREDYYGNYYKRDISNLSEKEQQVLELFRGLLPEMQNVVLNMIKDLYKTTTKT